MGNASGKSVNPEERNTDGNDAAENTTNEPLQLEVDDDSNDDNIKPSVSSNGCEIKACHEQTMEEFHEELRVKREHRISILSHLKSELTDLRAQLKYEKQRNQETPDVSSDRMQLMKDLANTQLELQLANAEILSLNTELDVTRKQVTSLKSVADISKQMIDIREEQVCQLKSKLKEIEESLDERELKLFSDQLRQEYTNQLEKMKQLKRLYEEKSRITAIECDNLKKELATIKTDLACEVEKSKTLTEDLEKTSTELDVTKTQLTSALCEVKQLQSEMTTINELSSQILMGFNSGNDINIDKLAEVLEANRGLLTDMTASEKSGDGASALPKVLFDLVVQAENSVNNHTCNGAASTSKDSNDKECGACFIGNGSNDGNSTNVATTEEIVGNLPKVWRVLMEFLNHHQVKSVECLGNDDDTDCYKSVQTPGGTEVVLSVSKTFIKLKDLILEKTSLQKETNRLKSLNKHLDDRLKSQENRLGVVTVELTKTWHLVGRMQRQHRQLHTNEQILRYQLQRKRKMLNELKEELEYCRKKWAQARQKNNDSEDQWRSLQREFAKRKLNDAANSGESGYSDEQNSDEELDLKNEKKVFWAATADTPKRSSSFSVDKFPADCNIETPYSDAQLSPESIRRGQSEPNEIYENINLRTLNNVDGNDQHEETLEEMFIRLSSTFDEPPLPPSIQTSPTQITNEQNNPTIVNASTGAEQQELTPIASISSASVLPQEPNNIESGPATSCNVSFSEVACSSTSSTQKSMLTETEEAYTARRAERIRRLEEQCKQLMSKVTNTANRGDKISNKLDTIHGRYERLHTPPVMGRDDESQAEIEQESTTEELDPEDNQIDQDSTTEELNPEDNQSMAADAEVDMDSQLPSPSDPEPCATNNVDDNQSMEANMESQLHSPADPKPHETNN